MKLSDFDFRIWDGKKYLKQKIYNDNINDNEYIAVTGNIDDENYVFTIEHGCERDYYSGDYDEYCKVKDFTSCNYEIELFTGYYDYKGNKIYIGDIIECLVFTNEKNSEIFYEIICFDMELGLCSKLSNGDGGYLFDLRRHKNNKTIEDVYVVGNIHENKELLKNKYLEE